MYFRRGGSYIGSPDWIKIKKKTINPKNEDDICFKYATNLALNHKEIKRDPEKISKIKHFINKYNWKGKTDDWKTFEKNNPTIALNIRILKKKRYFQLILQTITQLAKRTNNSLNDSK